MCQDSKIKWKDDLEIQYLGMQFIKPCVLDNINWSAVFLGVGLLTFCGYSSLCTEVLTIHEGGLTQSG